MYHYYDSKDNSDSEDNNENKNYYNNNGHNALVIGWKIISVTFISNCELRLLFCTRAWFLVIFVYSHHQCRLALFFCLIVIFILFSFFSFTLSLLSIILFFLLFSYSLFLSLSLSLILFFVSFSCSIILSLSVSFSFSHSLILFDHLVLGYLPRPPGTHIQGTYVSTVHPSPSNSLSLHPFYPLLPSFISSHVILIFFSLIAHIAFTPRTFSYYSFPSFSLLFSPSSRLSFHQGGILCFSPVQPTGR